MKIAAIGEAMIELSMSGDTADVRVAGDTLNTAIYLKRTAPMLEVDYITRVGTDAFSDRIVAAIEAEDIGTQAVERDPERTPGLYAITTDAAGERSFAYWRDSSAARMVFATPSGPDFSVLERYDVIYTSAITLAILPTSTRTALIRWLRAFRKRGGRVAFDSNYRPRLWGDPDAARAAIHSMWVLSDIALPSIDDEMDLTGESARAVVDRFVALRRTGALKRGAQGPLCLETGTSANYPAADKVVDTTAAGDSFNGAYLGALLMGAPQDQALRAGHALASEVIGHRGAILPH
ncbi:sugar kinase [Tateyamaria omphalii]|uniref:2-dehydro-3-deoxygluconokinase n=1 Tax=Tateyamaria omphalii TaxID=299262 RepID=A0A1P8MXX1_9RHOB|nr:sugar kinase [Tateyamaria omphalii]APX12935.1 2-dehydro-3-deoxygluconokinase [Tateyamaria omphalii]